MRRRSLHWNKLKLIAVSMTLSALGQNLAWGSPYAGASQRGESRILTAIEMLQHVPSGRALLAQAVRAWKLSSAQELTQVLHPGAASRTDAVLTRHYSPSSGTEIREREVTIYVREDQSLDNMVLDIAHEMVHATSRPAYDPYDPELTVGRYIKTAIEGEGGEVSAVLVECQVALELSRNFGMNPHRCRGYLSGDQRQVDARRIKADFYRVGKWDGEIKKTLGSEATLFPELSTESPRLFSSTGNAPYPAALLHEFQALTQIACENSKRRVSSVSDGPRRKLASVDSGDSQSAEDNAEVKTIQFLQRRCQ